MGLHGGLRAEQLRSDLYVRQPTGNRAKHFALAWGQQLHPRIRCSSRSPSHVGRDHASRHGGVQYCVTGCHSMDGREQFRHEDAAWAHLANTTAIFPGEDIPAQLVPDGDGAMMLCAIPCILPFTALGDVVRVEPDRVEVISRSGHGAVHLWFGDSFGPRDEIVERLVSLGALIERFDENLVAIDISPSIADAVLTLLGELESEGLIHFAIAQVPARILSDSTLSQISSDVRSLHHDISTLLDSELSTSILGALERGQIVLSVEKLVWAISEPGVQLTPNQHRALAHLLDVAGLPWELSPQYEISYDPVETRSLALAHSDVVRAASEWGSVSINTPSGASLVLTSPTMHTENGSIVLRAPEGLLMIVGAKTSRRTAGSLVISDYQFIQLVRPHTAWSSTCVVLLEGRITLRPGGLRNTVASLHENQLTEVSPSMRPWRPRSSLLKVLSRPRVLRELASKPLAWRAVTLFFLGLGATFWALTVGPHSEAVWPVLLLFAGVAVMVFAPFFRRRELNASEATMRAIGWLGVGHVVQGLSARTAVEVIRPREWPTEQSDELLAHIQTLLTAPQGTKKWARSLGLAVVRCRSAHTVDASLPQGVAVRRVSATLRPGAIYAIVPRTRGLRFDVLKVKPHALRHADN